MRIRLIVLVLLGLALSAPTAAAAPAASATVTVGSSGYGPVLFDGRGFAGYAFTFDRAGRSRCSGACARAWPPYLVKGTLRAGAGARGSPSA